MLVAAIGGGVGCHSGKSDQCGFHFVKICCAVGDGYGRLLEECDGLFGVWLPFFEAGWLPGDRGCLGYLNGNVGSSFDNITC